MSTVKIIDIEALAKAIETSCPELKIGKAKEYRTWLTDYKAEKEQNAECEEEEREDDDEM